MKGHALYLPPKDSRQRYTKQCLFDAFTEMMARKPVSQITVTEICEDAGISRKTFYKYYSDQFALLKAMQDDLFVGFQEQMSELPASIFEITPALIRFAKQHEILVRAIYENRGEGNFIDRMIAYLHEAYHEDWERANPRMPKGDVDFLFHYVTSGLVGIIRFWLVEEPGVDTDEIIEKARTLMQLSTPEDNSARK
jgi:AcrR family transcriptional regulator